MFRRATLCVILFAVLLASSVSAAAPKAKHLLVQFDAVPLIEVVRWASELTGKNFVVPEGLRQRKITIVSAKKVTAAEAYDGFLAALDAEGLVVEEEGKFLKITERYRGRAASALSRGNDCGLAEHIEKLGEGRYRIARAGLDKLLDDTSCWTRQGRIVPKFKEGKPDGFKLYAIRRSSFYHLLGFRNGDVVRKINAVEITSPEKALEIYTQLRGQSEFEVEVTRRGKTRTLVYQVK